ncbi:protoporphyrinogen oxidase [Aureococcus anophagefferens]|nr:protoporphyrinogen oxidase [Aureococcus anophagefferens]
MALPKLLLPLLVASSAADSLPTCIVGGGIGGATRHQRRVRAGDVRGRARGGGDGVSAAGGGYVLGAGGVVPQELGACYTSPDYTRINALLEELNLGDQVDTVPPRYVHASSGSAGVSLAQYTLTFLLQLPAVAAQLPRAATTAAIADLSVIDGTFGEWLDREDFTELRPILDIFQESQGYGALDVIPAYYGLLWSTPQALKLTEQQLTGATGGEDLDRRSWCRASGSSSGSRSGAARTPLLRGGPGDLMYADTWPANYVQPGELATTRFTARFVDDSEANDGPEEFVALALNSSGVDEADVRARVVGEAEALGATGVAVVDSFRAPNYNCRFSREGVQQGKPWDLDDLQGADAVFFVGGSYAFEAMEPILAHVQDAGGVGEAVVAHILATAPSPAPTAPGGDDDDDGSKEWLYFAAGVGLVIMLALAAIVIGYGTHVQHKRQIREIQAKKAVELTAAPGTMA